MKSYVLLIVLTIITVTAGCDGPGVRSGVRREALISKGFIDDNTYRVVCRGYALEGLTGIQQAESSKRAALLNAYFYIKGDFTDAVLPDRDGKAEKFDIAGDHAVVYYVVHKRGLKKMVKKAPGPGPKPDVNPEPAPDPADEQKTEPKAEQ